MESNMSAEKKSMLSLFFILPSLIIGLITIIVSIVCFAAIAKYGVKDAEGFFYALTWIYQVFFVASILAAISLIIAHYYKSKKTWPVVLLATWLTFAIVFYLLRGGLLTGPFLYALF
jgi:hypothetical protein